MHSVLHKHTKVENEMKVQGSLMSEFFNLNAFFYIIKNVHKVGKK